MGRADEPWVFSMANRHKTLSWPQARHENPRLLSLSASQRGAGGGEARLLAAGKGWM